MNDNLTTDTQTTITIEKLETILNIDKNVNDNNNININTDININNNDDKNINTNTNTINNKDNSIKDNNNQLQQPQKNTFKSSLSSFLTSYYTSSGSGSNSNTTLNKSSGVVANKTTYFGHVRNSISYVTSSIPIPSYNSLPSFNIPIISYLSNSIPFPISYNRSNTTTPAVTTNTTTTTTQPITINKNNDKQQQQQQLSTSPTITPTPIISMSPNSFNSISIDSSRLIINNNLGTEEQFQDILKRLDLQVNKLHLISLDSFIENIKNDATLSIEDISSSVQAYIATTLPMLMHVCASIPFQSENLQMIESKSTPIPTLQGKPIQEIEIIIYEFLEQYITIRLYRRIFSSSEGIQKDTLLCEHISKFQHIIPSNLDINDSIISTQFLEQIQEELLHMTAYKSPREKLMCVKKSFKLLFQLLSKAQLPPTVVGADLLLPIVIFCLIKSNLPFLFSNLQFISLFRDPSLIESETNYFLVTMITATSFIENMTFESLTDAIDPNLDITTSSNMNISSGDNEITDKDIINNNNNNNNNSDDNQIQNNNDICSIGKSLQQHESSKITIVKEKVIHENKQQPMSETEKKNKFKFYNSKPEELSVREIKELLSQYNQLVDKVCDNNVN